MQHADIMAIPARPGACFVPLSPQPGSASMRSSTLAATLAAAGLAASMVLAGACSQSSGGGSVVGPGVSSILFIKRQTTTTVGNQVTVDVAGGNGQVLDYQRYVPGGS